MNQEHSSPQPVDRAQELGTPVVGRRTVRRRMMAGILLVAPFLVTFWILSWLYLLLEDYFIAPTAKMVVRLVEGQTASELPVWFANYLAPLLGVLAVAVLLYFLGFFAQSRVVSLVNRFLLRVPIVTAIHRAVSRAFEALI